MRKIVFSFFSTSIFAAQIDSSHLLYLLHKDQINKCIVQYQEYIKNEQEQDFSILRKIGLTLLERGIKSSDKDIQILSLLGARLSSNSQAFEVLEKGFFQEDAQIQMLALNFLAKIDVNGIDKLLLSAMRSKFLPIRMEAAYNLAKNKHVHAVGQIEALMQLLPPDFIPYFPPLFALNGTDEAMRVLKRLINDPNPYVRIETIHALLQNQRDDFLPYIRKRLIGSHSQEKEICALALGYFQDKKSIHQLEKITLSKNMEIRLAAMKALYLLGKSSYKQKIEALALEKNIFAINALADIKGSEDTLYILTCDQDLQVRINAVYTLLKRKDPRATEKIHELLIQDHRELCFAPIYSLGKAHQALRCITSSLQNTKSRNINLALSFAIKEKILEDALYLDQKTFLTIANTLFAKEENSLIAQLVSLLENIPSEESINLLKKYSFKPGSPLIRTYCQLALFRLKEKGPYQDYICKFIQNNINHEMIELKPMLSYSERLMDHSYQLTSKQTTQLLVDCFSALASSKNEQSINCILEAIQKGNSKNRYALAGLLIHAVE